MITKSIFVLIAIFAAVSGNAFGGVVPAPSVPDLQNSSDSGWSSADNTTNSANAAFTIGGVTSGAAVQLLRNGTTVASGVAGNTSITLSDPGGTFDGAYQYTARQIVSESPSAQSAALTVTYDRTPPTVAINQDAAQSDPTPALPLRYSVVFSEPVRCHNLFPFGDCFQPENMNTAGSTAYTYNANYSSTGSSGPSYSVEVSDIQTPGMVVVNVEPHNFYDIAGNYNPASTSTDNMISFQPQQIDGNIAGRIKTTGGSLPHAGLQVQVTDIISGAVYNVPVSPTGNFRFSRVLLYNGVESIFSLNVKRKNQALFQDNFAVRQAAFPYPDITVDH